MKDFVSFEMAMKLKEKGFTEPCVYAYCKKGGWNKYRRIHEPITYILRTDGNPFGTYYAGNNWNKEYETNKNKIQCSAPTIDEVLKWLRVNKDIMVFPVYSTNTSKWYCTIVIADSLETYKLSLSDSFEDAALAGINYVLDNLI